MFFENTEFYLFIFSIFLFFLLFLNIFSLPANWFIFFAFLFFYSICEIPNRYFVLFVLLIIAVGGEIIESVLQFRISKKSGASTAGNWGGIVGAIVGAIIGFPLFFGIGSFLLALFGAFLGCFCVEKIRGVTSVHARKAALGALKGKFLGFILKITLGAVMIFYGLASLSFVTVEDFNKKEMLQQENPLPFIEL